MNKKNIISIFAVFLLLGSWVVGCGRQEKMKEIDVDKMEVIQKQNFPDADEVIRIALGGVITAKEGFIYYKQLLDYVSKAVGQPIEILDKQTYAEINELLQTGMVDMAFSCARPYVDGKDKFGLELLVAPQVSGKSVYYSYIIVPSNSPVKDFKDLKGKTFAFSDPGSNTGKLVPAYMLSKKGETPDSFFDEYIYTYAHDKTIYLVAQGVVDGGAVDSLIWDYQAAVNPEYTSQTRIILKSEPYGIPPVVVRPDLDPDLKSKLRDAMLNMHRGADGKKILQHLKIEKFVTIDDSKYNSIRGMKVFIAQQEKDRE